MLFRFWVFPDCTFLDISMAGPALLPIYVIEIGVFVMAAGTLVMALKMGRMEEL